MNCHFGKLAIIVLDGLAAIIFAGAAFAGQESPLVNHLLEVVNKTRGIWLVPRGGELAIDLAKGSEFVVVSQELPLPRPPPCAKADQAGLLGRRLYVAEAGADTPVLADNYANLLVIVDASDKLLAKLDRKTMLKVLTPHGGKAIVGLARNSSGGATEANLETWAKAFVNTTLR